MDYMPELVRRKLRGGTKEFVVYTKEEFITIREERKQGDDKSGYKHWRDVSVTVGDWVISDDDYVAEVIRINGPYDTKSGKEWCLVLPYCRKWVRRSKAGKLLAREFLDTGNYNSSSPNKTWIDQELKMSRAKRVVETYARLLMESGGVLSAEQYNMLGKLYRPDQKIPAASVKRLLKQEKTKSMVKEELARIMSENGLTVDAVIKTHQKIIHDAMDAGQLSVAEKANGRFMDMLDMKPDKTTTQVEAQITWDHLLDEGDDAEYEIEPKRRDALSYDKETRPREIEEDPLEYDE